MRIFRYVGPQRVDCLLNEEVSFSPPSRFNDPFDLRPVFVPVTDEDYLKRIYKQGGSEIIESGLSGLPSAQKKELEGQFEKLTIAFYRQQADKYAQAYQQTFPKTLDRYVGILCFSAINDNLLMWAHYADSHKGFALEFDSEDEEFKKLGDLYEVKYDRMRAVVDAVKQPTIEFYIRKSLEWGYEREYRLLRHLNACERRSLSAGDFYFVRMPRSCVKAVYLGTRMDRSLAQQISQVMSGTAAEIYETELHGQEFGLVFRRIK
jgi:DUF2971 family protein